MFWILDFLESYTLIKMYGKTTAQQQSKMDFMTLQRPTFEELERRRQLRENLSPNRGSTTLQRRESMISRGLNAIMRRQSFMGSSSKPNNGANLKRNDSFFMHSALLKDRDNDPGPSLLLPGGPPGNNNNNDQEPGGPGGNQQQHPLHTITRPSRPAGPTGLGRAKSFKYPERVSQIPPAEFTRLRSKSQVRPGDYYTTSGGSAGSSDDPVYTSGSGGSAAGSGKSMLRRNPTFLGSRGNFNNNDDYAHAPRYFQPPPRVLPRRPDIRPSPRDISEPPPGASKRRLPLPDIFFYGERWQEQENMRSRPEQKIVYAPTKIEQQQQQQHQNSSLETPEPPPGSSDIGTQSQNTR